MTGRQRKRLRVRTKRVDERAREDDCDRFGDPQVEGVVRRGLVERLHVEAEREEVQVLLVLVALPSSWYHLHERRERERARSILSQGIEAQTDKSTLEAQ
jgi:hypothetical protein